MNKRMFTGLGSFVVALASSPVMAAPVHYLRNVKPILAELCYRCHGVTARRRASALELAKNSIHEKPRFSVSRIRKLARLVEATGQITAAFRHPVPS